jgi:hypothetical protein
LDLRGVRLQLSREGELLRVGPGRLKVNRDQQRIRISFVPGPQASGTAGTPLTLRLEVPLRPGEVLADVEGGPASLAALGIQEGNLGLLDVARASITARGRIVLSADGNRIDFSGSGKLKHLALQHRWLSNQPLRELSLSWQGSGSSARAGTLIRIDQGHLQVGAVRAELRGELERAPDYTAIQFEGGVPLASCQAMLDSLPEGLAPLLAGMKLDGTFSLQATLQLDTRRPKQMRHELDLSNQCRITTTPPRVDPRRFARPWVRRVVGADGREISIESGPGTPDWVPFADVSRHLETAVLVCEDAHFFRHRGFDPEAIDNSIRQNVAAKRFVRGASTISMQLAKNLYLSHAKTLARKLQEAAFTLLLEQELSKQEILELYLNVIEFGPGIYGIGPAAQHYFNTNPADLSLGQSLYLASILPRPRQHHFGDDGKLSRGLSEYLRKLMAIAHKIKRISQDELTEGEQEQVTFGEPYSPPDLADSKAPGFDSADLGSESVRRGPPEPADHP